MTTTGRTKAKPAKSTSVRKATAKNSATKSAVRKSPAKPTSGSVPASGKGAVSPRSAEVKEARRFALSHNFGLSSRIRDLLDSKRPVLQIFIDENLPLARIQEFIQRKYGPKIPAKALGTYLDANFKAKK
ncbi:hypothetical protein Q6A26_03860 [Xanthomonas euvesicatoria pv. eucalypti]|uniref:hypothetical protein n=1 Tax=Xanthomonas euvesicatoria TaxID=456327 RepID=UPI0026E35664|nr:hypothetical protein [Xanthomonas euvesicatoria]MDO7931518.1 hypothetical protein [Xanthomonas euvesicatoria pv. eucalypti]MDO7935755.1 hypothetical protein [Xanthomonas euvesicatoria pv. eucalypti]MDO7940045.1 hypothetical protein [Xanthomonas euvesicatoria pv. eucalypti]MDO7944602.1 hypothetical protein [Xanthomonas euvesicatoria pv. eucalypti]MDO7952004.1 hypothetical protein [Xanthomonas euvesicatoria pv. eucalypti]